MQSIYAYETICHHLRNTKEINSFQNTKNVESGESRLGFDSHADMTCVGRDAHIIEHVKGQVCTVKPFHDSYKPQENISVCNALFAYDFHGGKTILLRINQCLDFSKSMIHSLLCTNQARSHGVIVEDTPRTVDLTSNSRQALILPESGLELPILMNGPVPYLPVRKPTADDIASCEIFDITSPEEWNPSLIFNNHHDFQHVSNVEIEIKKFSVDSYIFNDTELQLMMQNIFCISSTHHTKKGEINPQSLARLWNIPLEHAKRTLQTTDKFHFSEIHGGLTRRRRAGHGKREHPRLSGNLSRFASDTFFSNVTSLRGNKMVQLFTNRGNFTRCYPMKKRSEAPDTLHRFIDEIGIPGEMLTDGAPELLSGKWTGLCQKHRISMDKTEPDSPWQNPAELAGGILKRKVRRLMRQTGSSIRLWDYCWDYVSSIRNYTATDHYLLDGLTPHQKVTGVTPNISELIQYKWYQWIWYYDLRDPLKEVLGRYLGPAENCGEGFTSHILTNKGEVIQRSTTRRLTDDENSSEHVINLKSAYTAEMESFIGNTTNATMNHHAAYQEDPYENMFQDDNFDDEDILFQDDFVTGEDSDREAPLNEQYDEHLGLELLFPNKGEMKPGKVVSRKRDHTGHLIGRQNPNPILDTRIYEIQFNDGTYADYNANIIMENLYSQTDQYGGIGKILKGISNHRKTPEALSIDNGWVTMENNVKKRRVTTSGWDLLVDWVDGTQSWIPLYRIKQANPIETAEYAVSRGIQHEPAFAWWVGHTLQKRKHFISKLKSVVKDKRLKYGLRVPRSVNEAYQLDKENGNDYWDKAIKKELDRVIVAFKLLEPDEPIPVGSTKIPYHIIFDVKFDLTRKARLVAGGHKHKNVPAYETYSSVASRESVRIAFLIAALNNMNILSADIGNAYLNAPCRERVHVTVGPELFGQVHAGKTAVIVRALYGLKSAGAAWREHLSSVIQQQLKYKPSMADNDIYFKEKVNTNGEKYYAYLVVYVDDLLSIDVNPRESIDMIGSNFSIKKGSVGFPTNYLGSTIRKWKATSLDGSEFETIALGSVSYVKEAVRVCKSRMKEFELTFPTSSPKSPFTSTSYRPELDTTPECSIEQITLYQNLIGILRWICELGRLDVLLETNLLSQYMVSPREGHLRQLLNIFCYLDKHDRSWIVVNPEKFEIDWIPIKDESSPSERQQIMKKLYPDSDDPDPPRKPIPRGKSVQITVFCDANHAGNILTRRSQTGIIIYLNMTPILWISKRQNTVESSTFGSEFLALKHATELIKGLRYKLMMLGVPIEGPARLLCDNESVVINGSFPESVLKKKHCSIAYHIVRESIAAGIMHLYWESSKTNLADLFTKLLPHPVRHHLIQAMLH